jgi:hypothetical protein
MTNTNIPNPFKHKRKMIFNSYIRMTYSPYSRDKYDDLFELYLRFSHRSGAFHLGLYYKTEFTGEFIDMNK